MHRLFYIISFLAFFSCANGAQSKNGLQTVSPIEEIQGAPQAKEALEVHDKTKCFIVVSKLDLTLSVYETFGTDTLLVKRYPVCMGKNKGDKKNKGDMRTPESTLVKPFTITEIKDASSWTHDFGDGRGAILSYGHWFLRLSYGSGIGIHGSTNNEDSVPGRASEGCIRLRDADIVHLKENYAFVGMKVIVKAEEQGPFNFER